MSSFVSAGHNPKGIKIDPGAIGNGRRECDLTVEFRNLVVPVVKSILGDNNVVVDNDDETLAQYLSRAKTGNGSVVVEFHFDSASTPTATGCSAIVGSDADRLDKLFAQELADTTARVLGIRNRGVISEAESHRGRLGLMRETGTVALLEIGFISNISDLKAYDTHKQQLAQEIAQIIAKYDKLIA